MSNAFCTKCGAPLEPGASFCSSCGNRMEVAPPYQAPPVYNAAPAQPQYGYQQPQPGYGYQQPAQQYMYQPKKTKTGLIIGIIAAAAVVITGVLLLVFLLPGGGDASVKAAEINGSWSGTIKVENINTSITGLDDYIDPDTLKYQLGETKDLTMTIDLDKGGEGTVYFMYSGMDATYNNGRLSAEMKQTVNGDSIKVILSGSVSRKGDSYAFKGTWKDYYNDKEFASGTWTADMD